MSAHSVRSWHVLMSNKFLNSGVYKLIWKEREVFNYFSWCAFQEIYKYFSQNIPVSMRENQEGTNTRECSGGPGNASLRKQYAG